METLKFITQTTNYKDNELSLIAERITPVPLKRFQREAADVVLQRHRRKLIYPYQRNERGGDLLHSARDALQLTFSGHGLGIISKSDFDH